MEVPDPERGAIFDHFDALAACEVEVTEAFLEMLREYHDAPTKERRIREIRTPRR
ncbi:MAG: hypothetical protein QM784_06910 [Polyangiaceae bacterium]